MSKTDQFSFSSLELRTIWGGRPNVNHKIRFSPRRRIGWNRLGPLVSGWFAPLIQSKHFGLITLFWTDFENANSRSELIGYMNFVWPMKKLDLTTPFPKPKQF